MADANAPVVFGGAAAGRIAQAVRTVERATRGDGGRGRRRIPVYTGGGTQGRFAVSPAAGIPARTGSPTGTLFPGAATCRLYAYTSALVYQSASTVSVLNPWAGSVVGNKLIRVVSQEGYWWVVNEDCTAGASAAPPQSTQGFSSTAFSSGFASTQADTTNEVEDGAFSAGFGLDSFGGSGLQPVPPPPPP